MAIFVTGDTHGANRFGTWDINGYKTRFSKESFPEQKTLTKDDYVIICGDFGGVWLSNRTAYEEPESEKKDLDWLENRNFTTLFVPGNHENYDRLTGCKDEKLLNSWSYKNMPDEEKDKLRKGYPKKRWHGGTVRQIRPSILMLDHGVFDIAGNPVLCVGGASSHDIHDGILYPYDFKDETSFEKTYRLMYKLGRQIRVSGISWWKQEVPEKSFEKKIMNALTKKSDTVHFVFSHDAPSSDVAMLGYSERNRLNTFMEDLKSFVTYGHWFFGHYHDNRTLPGGKDHLLYEQIVQID